MEPDYALLGCVCGKAAAQQIRWEVTETKSSSPANRMVWEIWQMQGRNGNWSSLQDCHKKPIVVGLVLYAYCDRHQEMATKPQASRGQVSAAKEGGCFKQLWHLTFSLGCFRKLTGYSHWKGCWINTEINFPKLLLSFHTAGQNNGFLCVLGLVYVKGTDSHEAKELHLIHSATLLLEIIFSYYLTSVSCLSPSLLLKSFWRSQSNLKFQTNLSLQLPRIVLVLYQTQTDIVPLILLFLLALFLFRLRILSFPKSEIKSRSAQSTCFGLSATFVKVHMDKWSQELS